MGIIVKVYIENIDEEIDIVTLNSEDKKSSSVTITASVIKDYLNKLGRNDDVSSHRNDRIISKSNEINSIVNCNNEDGRSLEDSLVRPSVQSAIKSNLNSDEIQSENVTCSHSCIYNKSLTLANEFLCDRITENNEDHEVNSQSSNSNTQLNYVQNCVQVIDDTIESGYCVMEQDNLPATKVNWGTSSRVVNFEAPSCDVSEDTNLSMCIDDNLSENPWLEDTGSSASDIVDTHSQVTVTQNNETDCDNTSINFDTNNEGEDRLKNNINSSDNEMVIESEVGAENVIASLKNISYEVDDFLNMINTTPTRHNQNISHLRLLDDSPSVCHEEMEDDGELEEYFVIEKIAASRFNEETKVLEFLLKAQKCVARKESWTPIQTNITDLTISQPECLYIQCPKSFKTYKKKLREKFDQYIQFVNTERGFMYDLPSETISNCPSVIDITTNEMSSVITTDVVVDPQKSLNDACLIESCVDDNRNITPVKLLKHDENIHNISDIGLPSAHFYIADMIPELGDQLIEFVENNPIPSTNPINKTEVFEKPSNVLPSDRARKKNRNDNKHLECPHCSYRTVSANTLENHLRRHTNAFFKCRLCPKQYLSSARLKSHEKSHTRKSGGLLLEQSMETGISDSFVKTTQKAFLELMKNEVEMKSPFDRNASIKSEHSQSSLVLNETVASNCILFNECDVKYKMKQNSKIRRKKPKGRPKQVKMEPRNEPDHTDIIDLCDDGDYSECVAPELVLTNATPDKSEILQQCLASTVEAIENGDLLGSVVVDQSRKNNYCYVCKQIFLTAFDLFCHEEKFHKYPIVLLKRVSIPSY